MSDSPYKLDKKLLQAYKDTHYKIPSQQITIKIGQLNKDLRYFLIDNKVYSFTIITAYNPLSQIQNEVENESAHAALKTILVNEGFTFLLAKAEDPNDKWPVEVGFIVFDIPLKRAKKLAMSFRQNAVVYGNITIAPQLIAL